MVSIKGYKSQQALQQKLAGYSEDQSVDKLRYTTIQEMSGRRHALDVAIHGAYQITTVPKTIESGSNIRTIKITSHGANKNDIIRLSDGTQFSALSVPDANTIITSVELDVSPVGDTCTIWRHITPSYNADGSLNVSVTPSPVAYNRKSGGTTIATTVLEDLDNPANSRSLPVTIHSIDGAGINITAGDLNVQLSDTGANPDVTRIGDGTNRLGITALNEAKVIDAALNAAITTEGGAQPANVVVVGGHNGAGVARHFLVDASGRLAVNVNTSALPTGASTSALQTTGNTSLSSIDTKLTSQATAANQTAQSTLFGAVTETAPATDTASSGLNGRLQRIAQRVTSLIALFPTALGQGTMATSMKVVLPSDQSAIPVTMAAVPTGGATSALQTTGNTSLGNIDTDIGATADAVATTDTGTFSLIALTKRVAQNITTMSAKLPTALGAQVAGSSISVVQASSSSFSVVDLVRVPTYGQSLVITQATAITLTAPLTARTMKVQADNTNSVNLRYKIAATPTASSGHQLEPGRSEDWTVAGDVVVIAESTASDQKIYVTWGA